MSKKKVAIGVGAALAAVASVVTLGFIRKNKNKGQEVKKEKKEE